MRPEQTRARLNLPGAFSTEKNSADFFDHEADRLKSIRHHDKHTDLPPGEAAPSRDCAVQITGG